MTGAVRRDILNGWQVLIVEDEPDSLDIATRVLRHYGAEVHSATNGEAALQALDSLQPHFMISDLSMPVMDGWSLIQHLKHDRRWIDIPVIALTAHALKGDREKAIAAGFHNYLTKPLTAGTFIRELLALLVEIPQFAAELQQEG